MLNYTGTITFAGSILGGSSIFETVSGNLGVVLSASLPNGTSGTATEQISGTLYYAISRVGGPSESRIIPYFYTEPNIAFSLGDSSYSRTVPITNFGVSLTVGISADVNATTSQVDETFNVALSGAAYGVPLQGNISGGGSLIARPSPLSIGGGGGLVTTDLAASSPFQGITISDPNDAQTDTVTITLSNAADGTLTDLNGGSYDPAAGVYTVSGSAASVSAAVRQLVFVPTAHQVLPGQSVTTDFNIAVTDSLGGTAANNLVSVTATAVRAGFEDQRFNGGNTSDVLFRSSSSGLVLDWQMNNGQLEAGQPIYNATPDWSLAGTGDFTGNGTDDILFQNNQNGVVMDWQLQNGTLVAGHVIGEASSGWAVIGTGDFNGDGTDDILFQNRDSGLVVDWQMQNGSLVAGSALGIASFDWQFVGSGDFYGTGTDDLLFENRISGTILDWQMQNGTLAAGHVIGTASHGWSVVGIGDFTGSGTDDILFQNTPSGALAEWQIADGSYASGVYLGPLSAGRSVVGVGSYTGTAARQVLLQDASGNLSYLPLTSGGNLQGTTIGYVGPDWKLA